MLISIIKLAARRVPAKVNALEITTHKLNIKSNSTL